MVVVEAELSVLLSPGDLGAMLRRSPRALRTDDRRGVIPRPVRVGGSKRWRRAEIEAWVEAGCPSREEWDRMCQQAGGPGA
jgi:hypothetical protein